MPKSMLLHVCCAPCSTHVIDKLRGEYDLTCYFYNPNIYPPREYLKRLREMRAYSRKVGVGFMPGDYDFDSWVDATMPLKDEGEGSARCDECFRMRLESVAKAASGSEADCFASTLSISPHKNAESINRIGRELGKRHDVRFLESDFKKENGFRKSVRKSRDEGLYRQDYCGCFYSRVEKRKR